MTSIGGSGLTSLSRRHNGVVSEVLDTLGKLSAICGEDIVRYLDVLIPLIINTLQETGILNINIYIYT